MKIEKLNKLISKGRVQAIVKNVAGRRMLFGFERLNKRSRKYHVKHLSKPIDLAQLGTTARQKIAAQDSPPSSPSPAPQPTQPPPSQNETVQAG